MNINESHISLLSRALENDSMFIHTYLNKKDKDHSSKWIRFAIRRNRHVDGLILTDHA